MVSLIDLPNDIFTEISFHLNLTEFTVLRTTCKGVLAKTDRDKFIERIYEDDKNTLLNFTDQIVPTNLSHVLLWERIIVDKDIIVKYRNHGNNNVNKNISLFYFFSKAIRNNWIEPFKYFLPKISFDERESNYLHTELFNVIVANNQTDMANILLKSDKFNPSISGDYQNKCLKKAVKNGYCEMLEILLACNKLPKIGILDICKLFHIASRLRRLKIIIILCRCIKLGKTLIVNVLYDLMVQKDVSSLMFMLTLDTVIYKDFENLFHDIANLGYSALFLRIVQKGYKIDNSMKEKYKVLYKDDKEVQEYLSSL